METTSAVALEVNNDIADEDKQKNLSVDQKVSEKIIKVSTDEATEEFFGYLVELDCGEEESYRGIITEVYPADNESSAWGKVKLEKPYRNGIPFDDQDKTAILVPGELIQDIKVLLMPDYISSPTKSNDIPNGFVPIKKVAQHHPHSSSATNIASSSSQKQLLRGQHMTGDQFLGLNLKLRKPLNSNAKPFQPVLMKREKKILSITPPMEEGVKEEKQSNPVNEIKPPIRVLKKEPVKAGKDKEKSRIASKQQEGVSNKFIGRAISSIKPLNETGRVGPKSVQSSTSTSKAIQSNSNTSGSRSFKSAQESFKSAQGKITCVYNSNSKRNANATQVKQTGEARASQPPPPSYGQFRPQRSTETSRPSVAQSLLRRNSVNKPRLVSDEQILTDFNRRALAPKPKPPYVPRQQEQKPKNILSITPPADEKPGSSKDKAADSQVKANGGKNKAKENLEKEATTKKPKKGETNKDEEGKKRKKSSKEKDERNRLTKEKRAKEEKVKLDKDEEEKKKTEDEVLVEKKKEGEVLVQPEEGGGGKDDGSIGEAIQAISQLQIGTSEAPPAGPSDAAKSQNNTDTQSSSLEESNVQIMMPPGAEEYVGKLASIKTDAGTYQGVISAIVDSAEEGKAIHLEKAMLNGVPAPNIAIISEDMRGDISIFQNGTGIGRQARGDFSGRDKSRHNNNNYSDHHQHMAGGGTIYMQSMPMPKAPPSTPPSQSSAKRRFESPTGCQQRHSPRTFVKRETPTPLAQFTHQAYGDYKRFIQPQVPTPVRLLNNAQPKPLGTCGPTGNPAMDCVNGYRGYNDVLHTEDTMGDALDHETLNTDFDFAGNLALFNKKDFVKKTEHVFSGLDTGGNNSRNYRNDENILIDPSRIISWTSAGPSTGAGFGTPSPKSSDGN